MLYENCYKSILIDNYDEFYISEINGRQLSPVMTDFSYEELNSLYFDISNKLIDL